MRKATLVHLTAALAVLATSGVPLAITSFSTGAYAQTHGMTRRADRRDTRQGAREQKHACNAAGGNSRAECRQEKRDTKQEARRD